MLQRWKGEEVGDLEEEESDDCTGAGNDALYMRQKHWMAEPAACGQRGT